MRKFSKILEQKENLLIEDIKFIFIELLDNGFKIDIKYFQGLYIINLTTEKKINHMDLIKDLVVADNRLNDIGLQFYSSVNIILQAPIINNQSLINLKYILNNRNSLLNKDINSWDEFKLYCNEVLKVDGISGKDFRINVASREGWSAEEYFGWEIEIYGDEDEFISQYPGYEEFLKDILKRKLNYDGLWERPLKSNINNPLKFDKEGIETVEKLIEMGEKFPDKIEIKRK
jgi:hypothetical protein